MCANNRTGCFYLYFSLFGSGTRGSRASRIRIMALCPWSVPENIDINVTLFRDPRQIEFEDKEWTFVIEDVSILHNVKQ